MPRSNATAKRAVRRKAAKSHKSKRTPTQVCSNMRKELATLETNIVILSENAARLRAKLARKGCPAELVISDARRAWNPLLQNTSRYTWSPLAHGSRFRASNAFGAAGEGVGVLADVGAAAAGAGAGVNEYNGHSHFNPAQVKHMSTMLKHVSRANPRNAHVVLRTLPFPAEFTPRQAEEMIQEVEHILGHLNGNHGNFHEVENDWANNGNSENTENNSNSNGNGKVMTGWV